MNSPLASLSRFDFLGVMLLRTGVGALFAYHGYPILFGGDTVWREVGSAASIATLNDDLFWIAGLSSGLAQLLGGLLLIVGLFTRATSLLLFAIAGFALANTIAERTFDLSFFALLQLALASASLAFMGPGRLSLDRKGI